MNKWIALGLSAAYAGMSLHAAEAATRYHEILPSPASHIATDRADLVGPGNFDASLRREEPVKGLSLPAEKRLSVPETIAGGLEYRRLRPAPLLADHYDEKLGKPTFVWAGKSVGDSLDFLAYRQGEGADAYARAYLKTLASRLAIAPDAVEQARQVFIHDDGEGAVIARYQQVVDGLDVMGRQLNVVMNQDLELIAVSGYFATAKGAAQKSFGDAFVAGPQAAMDTAFRDLGLPVSAYNLYETSQRSGGFTRFAPTAGLQQSAVGLTVPVAAKKVLFPLGGELVPGWYLTVQAGLAGSQDGMAYSYVASADGSRVLFRKNLVEQDSFQYRVYADATSKQPADSPFGNAFMPHPTGNPADPLSPVFGSGTLVTVADGTQGIADPWLPAPIAAPPGLGGGPLFVPATQTTFGNNTYAYADVGGNDGPEDGVDVFAATTVAGVFDYTVNPLNQPTDATNQQAAIVNLFYLNNWLHDSWYNAGFTETAGNAQYSNYGRGGFEDTYILAEAQDSSGRNNANMATGPDGTYTRMQMYIFDGPVEIQRVEITAPAGIAQILSPIGSAAFGPSEYATLSASVVLYQDATAPEADACEAAANAGALAGNIALIDRGACAFTQKVTNAESAGAVAALIVNNEGGDTIINLGGTPTTAITIPSLMISTDDGQIIKDELTVGGGSVTVEMERDIANDRDGSLDAQVVAHEFFHYVSNRLVGDAAGLSNVQGRGMGEGWSDVAALLLSVREDDLVNQPDGAYTIGAFDTDDFYYAIRRAPYTTDMAANPLTFQYIEQGVALPAATHGYAYGADGSSNAEVHSVGEIWALPLWEAYVALYKHYEAASPGTGFATAKAKMQNYLIESLMATPNAPTMIEARDAILSTVQAADATDYGIFVDAFAKRGMGWGASAPDRSSGTLAGVSESFETDLKTYVVEEVSIDTNAPLVCDADSSLDPGETGSLTITVSNIGSADLDGVTAQLSSTSDISFANGGLVTFDQLPQFGGKVTATADVTVNSATALSETMTVDIAFPDVGATAGEVVEPAGVQVSFLSNQDFETNLYLDDVNNPTKSGFDWSTTSTGSVNPWVVDGTYTGGLPSGGPFGTYWYGVDNGAAGTIELVTPEILVGSDPFSLSFYHYFQFEADTSANYDGGVLEVSVDGGSWQDVTDAGGTFATGYNGTITATGYGNPLEGRDGFVDFGGDATETVSFGTTLSGSTVQFRFRVGTDEAVGQLGWIVDDIEVAGAAEPVFSEVVAEDGICGGNPPVADAGPDQSVEGAVEVTLDGSASSDDYGISSYQWTQTAGTAVTLSDATAAQPTFTTVDADATLTFELTVTDEAGQTATDSVDVTVAKSQDDQGDDNDDQGGNGGGNTGGGGGGSTGLFLLAGLLGLGLFRRRRS